ncbi:hypothetical protein CPB84DRAFT_1770696 [Gymnopilus junonius]|uniref:Uncharacterized protein n=1 Tax=Gymnopilus junonius TaxID=109634 RepID=A0A9P5NW77_GYMJU|nr:hypothetical protein CPB84DRAFT_1770696 [Gymnopilus junonius]
MSNEAPIVIAPRPVRLTSSFFTYKQDSDDVKLAFNVPESSSSRSPLPSEALEEFLSILTPSLLHKPRTLAFPTLLPERNIALYPAQIRPDQTPSPRDDPQRIPEAPKSDSKSGQVDFDSRWFSSVLLSSPVSRLHTRNPFQRYHELRSPTPISPINAAAIPLPSPTPSELIEDV